MSLSLLTKATLLVAFIYCFKLISKRGAPNAGRLPPGPAPKPLIGNLLDLPPKGQKAWIHWLKHKELYGPISSVTTLGQTIVIVNDPDLARDLLEKQSAFTASRPRLVFASELAGYEYSLSEQSDLRRVRAYRKKFHRILGSRAAVAQFDKLQEIESQRLLFRTLHKPEELVQHIKKLAGAIILKIGYGYTVAPHGPDPFVDLANTVMDNFSVAVAPATWLVDIFPALKWVPSWVPGAGFQRTAVAYKEKMLEFGQRPFEFVESQMRQGTHRPSFLSQLLEEDKPQKGTEEEIVVKWSAASMYAAGTDTIVAALSCIFLAMAIHPEVQQKAQAEIDRVIGVRLPTVEDRNDLPYIEAIVKEILRWHPVAPLGLPHRVTEDRVCAGYLIPKDAVVLAGTWGFMHDPNIYHDPTAFKPERFLGADPETDPRTFAFGYGRRVCPGRILADWTLYLGIAQSLAVFDIRNATQRGRPVGHYPDFNPGIVSHPDDFQVDIKPRSMEHKDLVSSVEKEHPWEDGERSGCRFSQ